MMYCSQKWYNLITALDFYGLLKYEAGRTLTTDSSERSRECTETPVLSELFSGHHDTNQRTTVLAPAPDTGQLIRALGLDNSVIKQFHVC